jgi:hypothetical protein
MKRCTLYNESDSNYQQDLSVYVELKGTEYVSLQAPDILPDSLPPGKQWLRTGLPVLRALDRSAVRRADRRRPPRQAIGRERRSQPTPCTGLNAGVHSYDIVELDPPFPMAGEAFTAYVKVTNTGEPA